MEDVFQQVRNGTIGISSDLGNLLLACSDTIEQMLDDIEGGGDSSSSNPEEQIRALKDWLSSGPARGSSPAVPAIAEPSGEVVVAEPQVSDKPLYDIRIAVADECMMKDVRALLAIGNLESLGTILSSNPTKEAVDEGNFDGVLQLRLASDAGEEALKTAASGAEIAAVEIQEVHPREPAKMSSPLAEKRQPDAEKKQLSQLQDKAREIKNLRVDLSQLDHIMNLVEDLVINRGRLKQIAEKHHIKEMDEAIGMVERSVSELQNLMMNIRMIPLNHIFNRLPRVVRDVAQYDGKEVEFVMEGGQTELDRSVMDGLNDPLLHLIRNAVNHRIEAPEAREKAGKPRKGFVKLAAHRDRDNVIIELIDDGGGINVEKVKRKAVEKGMITREAADALTTDQAIDLLFQPGFSTADKITDISGRGSVLTW
jgi:two-component system chemotaxis sensor kinase CheA